MSNFNRILQSVLIVAVVLLALVVWRQSVQLAQVNSKKETVVTTPASPAPAIQTAQSTPAETDRPASTEAARPDPSASAPPAPPPPLELTPTGRMAPPPRTSGLTLAGTQVAPVEGGLRATLHFTPTTQEPLGIIDLVVRLPRDGESKILGLDPAGSARYEDVAQRVSEDGKFAIFHGILQSGDTVEFALSVSGEAVADVRGSTGIGAFDLTIGPGGTSVRAK